MDILNDYTPYRVRLCWFRPVTSRSRMYRGYPDLRHAISIEKRYFTSDFDLPPVVTSYLVNLHFASRSVV